MQQGANFVKSRVKLTFASEITSITRQIFANEARCFGVSSENGAKAGADIL